jgi:hypothetical protein
MRPVLASTAAAKKLFLPRNLQVPVKSKPRRVLPICGCIALLDFKRAAVWHEACPFEAAIILREILVTSRRSDEEL